MSPTAIAILAHRLSPLIVVSEKSPSPFVRHQAQRSIAIILLDVARLAQLSQSSSEAA